MSDRERVLDAFRNCITEPKCKDCPWTECSTLDNGCVEIPRDLALAVMRELVAQEPRVMTLEEVIEAAKQGEPMYICEAKFPGSARWIIPINADHWGFEERGSHCQLHYYDYLSKQIGGFCCWTSRPTEEQRRETSWP